MKDYTSIRLTVSTRDALEEYRDRLQIQVDRASPGRFPAWLGRAISLETALEYLLCQQQRHTERGRMARRAKKAAEVTAVVTAVDNTGATDKEPTIDLDTFRAVQAENTEGAVSEESSWDDFFGDSSESIQAPRT